MLYQVAVETRTAGDRTGEVVTLKSPTGARAEIWPSCGFNCLRWSVAPGQEALFAMPDWEQNPVPTRSGIPILAPFPNRIRDGRFTWNGKTYQLPLNDSTRKNAIHGEAPRHAWGAVTFHADAVSASVSAHFRPSRDAAAVAGQWTGDYDLSATWELVGNVLKFTCEFSDRSNQPMPFGLGLHPYLRFPAAPADERIDASILQVDANTLWELKESLPTAKKVPVSGDTDFLNARLIGPTNIDHLYTGLTGPTEAGGMRWHGRLTHPNHPGALEVWADGSFREIVMFTPVHRKAVCIEPYTCATDAVNAADPAAAGLIVVGAGESVQGSVEFRWIG